MHSSNAERIARRVAQRLLVRQRGPMRDPGTWADVARQLGHPVLTWHEPGGCVAEYLSAEAGSGVIRYNTAHSPPQQARGIVHETAHAELAALASGLHRGGECPGSLAGERQGYDDTGGCSHEIARRVEEICFRV